jgi:hypothetical protein
MDGICCGLIIVSDSQDHSIVLVLRLYSSGTAALISVLGSNFFPFLCLMILLQQQQQPHLSMLLLLPPPLPTI